MPDDVKQRNGSSRLGLELRTSKNEFRETSRLTEAKLLKKEKKLFEKSFFLCSIVRVALLITHS